LAGRFSTTGNDNTFVGFNAGADNTGDFNTAFGSGAGQNSTGNANAFFGGESGAANNSGTSNSFFGRLSGSATTTGNENSFFGRGAGDTNATGSRNTMLGGNADVGASNLTNATAIGARAFVTQSNSLVLGSINGSNGAVEDTNIGIGTTAPAARLHIVGDPNAAPDAVFQSNGGTASISLNIGGTDLAQFRVASDGSLGIVTTGPSTGNISFNAGTTFGASDMTIQASTGNVGVGQNNSNPSDRVDVDGNLRVGVIGGTVGCVRDRDATVIAGTCSSDLRFKRNVVPFGNVLNRFRHLQPVTFYWRAGEFSEQRFGTNLSFGLIAQDVERLFPDLVTTDENGFRAVNYSKLPLLTIQAMKEQQAMIERQQKQIDELKQLVCLANKRARICKERKK
jgi:hypothetical protein